MSGRLGRDRIDYARHLLENGQGVSVGIAIPLLAGEPVVPRRPSAGSRVAARSQKPQPAPASAALGDERSLRWSAGLGRPGQPRYRRAPDGENLEPDDSSD